MDPSERKLNAPEEEEGYQVGSRDTSTCGEMVRNVCPSVTEDAAECYGEETAGIIGLSRFVEDGDNASDEDEEEGAIDARGHSDIRWETDMVPSCSTRVEEEYNASKR